MDQLVPAVETWQHTYYQAINNRGETVGYARLQDSTTEVFIDRHDQDRDADGISDDWESYYGLNPDDATDANLDPDGDGISNLGEYRLRRDPNNQDTQSGETGQVADTRPGIDTDGDGIVDGFMDGNGDGLADSVAAVPLTIPNTDETDGPDFLDLDADDDGLTDTLEAGGVDADGNGRPDIPGPDDNGDGLDDILVGASAATGTVERAGRAWLLLGVGG